MFSQTVKIRVAEGGIIPSYADAGCSGMDLHCTRTISLQPGQRDVVETGIFVELPENYEFQIRPRSGYAANYGLTVTNSPGTIDASYRGEIRVILQNTGEDIIVFNEGDRIAQMVLCPVIRCVWELSDDLSETERGGNGFGSSGI